MDINEFDENLISIFSRVQPRKEFVHQLKERLSVHPNVIIEDKLPVVMGLYTIFFILFFISLIIWLAYRFLKPLR